MKLPQVKQARSVWQRVNIAQSGADTGKHSNDQLSRRVLPDCRSRSCPSTAPAADKRERERERDRDRDRDRDRETDRQTETERQRHRTETETGRQAQTDRDRDRQTETEFVQGLAVS